MPAFTRQAAAWIALVLLCAGEGCGRPACDGKYEPDYPKLGDAAAQEAGKPAIPVPSLDQYGWLDMAGISLGSPGERPALEAKIQDYYSGYPAFLKALQAITKDEGVGLPGEPAFLGEIASRYYVLAGADESSPLLSTSGYDPEIVRQATFEAWKKANPEASASTFAEIVRDVEYGP